MSLNRGLQDALLIALKRGVRVRIFTNSPASNDLWWTSSDSLSSALRVVKAGGELIMPICTKELHGHVHGKMSVIDKRLVLIGSWNAWLRSHFYETESNLLVDNSEVGSYMHEQLAALSSSESYRVWGTSDIEATLRTLPAVD